MSSIKKRWSAEIIREAKRLRRSGYSFGRLVKELGVARSTLHSWVGQIKRSEKWLRRDRIRWMKEIQPLTVLANKRKREERVKKIAEEVKSQLKSLKLNNQIYQIILSMLYWAEGSKRDKQVTFANTDPKLSLLFITLLRKCYPIDEKRLRLRIYLHYYHKKTVVLKFWSELLGVPIGQFQKTFIKHRSKTKRFRQNYAGICFIRYSDVVIKDKIMLLAFAIADKIVGDKLSSRSSTDRTPVCGIGDKGSTPFESTR